MRYPRAIKPNYALNVVNVFGLDAGNPALADDDYLVANVDMKVGAYTIAHASSVDGLARNIIATHATVAAGTDTIGTITVTGTNVDGDVISEVITPGADAVTAGVLAFQTVTAVEGADWVTAGGKDKIKLGFGNKIGLPSSIRAFPGPVGSAASIFGSWLGGAPANTTVTWDADEIEKCTVDASASTYNSTDGTDGKNLTVLIRR